MTREEMKEGGFYNAFLDCYYYLQRFGKVTADDAFWRAATAAGSEISRRYAGTPAAKMTNAILIAVYNELQRRLSNGCEIAEKRPRGGASEGADRRIESESAGNPD